MYTLKFVISHYLALGLLAVLAYAFGRRLTRRLDYQTRLEETCFALALGLGLIAYLVLLLGLLGLLYRPVALGLLGAGFLLCAPVWAGWPRRWPRAWGDLKGAARSQPVAVWCLIAALAALAVPFCLLPLYPPTQADATAYHLPYAKIYIEQHRLVLTPYLRFPVSPQTNQMLFTLALLVGDDVLAQLIEFLMTATVMAAVVAFGRRFLSPRAGWWAAAGLAASPILLYVGTCALIDIGVTLYTVMTVYSLWIWRERRRTIWLTLAGVFCGLAVGTKLTALLVLGICGLVVLLHGFRERRPAWPLIFGAVALLVALPWLARSFYYTGNPIYPMLHGTVGRVFRTAYWRPEYYGEPFDDLGYYLNPAGLSALLRLPWRLSFEYPIPYATAGVSRLYFFMIPALLFYGLRDRRLRWLLGFTGLYLFLWFLAVHDVRYLVPTLPALSLATAEALDQVARRIPGLKRWAGAGVVTVAGIAILAAPGWLYAVTRLCDQGRFPVTPGQREDYLTRLLPTYHLYQGLNRTRGRDYTIYAFFNPHMAYFADGVFIGDYYGEWQYSRLLEGGWEAARLADGPELYRQLRGLGVNYLLIDMQLVGHGLPRRVDLPRDEFFAAHFKLLYARAHFLLFELTGQPSPPARGPELLVNPGFESLAGAAPAGWESGGGPLVDDTGAQSHGGRVAVRAEGVGRHFAQTVALPGPGIYSLRFRARAPDPRQQARFWLDWSDARGQIIAGDMREVEVTGEWAPYEMFVSSPSGAAFAIVRVTGDGESVVWFDDFSLAAVEYP